MSAASVLMKIDCVYSTNVLASEKVYVKLQIMAELSMEKSRKTFSFNGNVRVTRAGTMPNIAKFFWIDCKTLNFGNSDFSISVKKNLFERLISSACKLKLVQMRHVVALKVNFEFDIINIENMPKLCTFLIKWLVNTPTIILIIKQFLSMNLDGKWKIQNEEFCNHFHFSAKLNGLFYYNFHRAWSRNFPFCVTHQIKEFYNKSTALIDFVF